MISGEKKVAVFTCFCVKFETFRSFKKDSVLGKFKFFCKKLSISKIIKFYHFFRVRKLSK